jgi:tetratricopeptide (TPR) repeat protein
MFFEQAREHAEREYKANNKDAMVSITQSLTTIFNVSTLLFPILYFYFLPNLSSPAVASSPTSITLQALTKWGGALLELAHFRQGGEAYEMIEEAIEKFEKALQIDSKRHDALWCLGNAYTSQGFLSGDASSADGFFTKAGDCFQKAVDQEPTNESYKRALEMSSKAPQLYEELQRQLQAAGASLGSPRGEGGGSSGGRGGAGGGLKTEPVISDFWYDVGGWVTLVALGFGIVALSRTGASA